MAVTDAAVVVALTSGSPILALVVWILLLGLVLLFSGISIYQLYKKVVYFPECKSSPVDFYEFYYHLMEKNSVDD